MTRSIILTLLLMLCTSVQALEVTSLEGHRVKVGDYTGNGRWTLVMVWSLDCIPCEQQKPMIEQFHQQYQDTDAHVVGLVLDGREKILDIRKRLHKHNTSYPNLIAFTDVIAGQLLQETGRNVVATPSYLLYAPDGKYVGMHSGPVELQQLVQAIGR